MGTGLDASAVAGCGGGGGADGDDSAEKDDDLVAPVSIPPLRFFNLGIPPAKRPPSCGGSTMVPSPPLLSLLLRTLDVVASLGFSSPGIGGALGAGPPPSFGRSRIGAERSFVTAFFNRVPFVISESSAPCRLLIMTMEMMGNHLYRILRCWRPGRRNAGIRWQRWRRRSTCHTRRWWRRRWRRHVGYQVVFINVCCLERKW